MQGTCPTPDPFSVCVPWVPPRTTNPPAITTRRHARSTLAIRGRNPAYLQYPAFLQGLHICRVLQLYRVMGTGRVSLARTCYPCNPRRIAFSSLTLMISGRGPAWTWR